MRVTEDEEVQCKSQKASLKGRRSRLFLFVIE